MICYWSIAGFGSNMAMPGLCSFTINKLLRVEVLSLVLRAVFISFICEKVVSHDTLVGGIQYRISMIAIIIGKSSLRSFSPPMRSPQVKLDNFSPCLNKMFQPNVLTCFNQITIRLSEVCYIPKYTCIIHHPLESFMLLLCTIHLLISLSNFIYTQTL